MKPHTLRSAAALMLLAAPMMANAAASVVDVYKSAYCGCCGDWVKHLENNGFTVKAHNVANPSDYREKHGIPNDFGSCHTAVVAGYAVEGHVPACISGITKRREQGAYSSMRPGFLSRRSLPFLGNNLVHGCSRRVK